MVELLHVYVCVIVDHECDIDVTDGVGFPRFILVLLRKDFWDYRQLGGKCVALN